MILLLCWWKTCYELTSAIFLGPPDNWNCNCVRVLIADVDWCHVHCCLFNVFRDVVSFFKQTANKSAWPSHLYFTNLWLQEPAAFQEILRINFCVCYLFERRVSDRSKWPPNQNFVRTNRHFGRTLSFDRPLFWALCNQAMNMILTYVGFLETIKTQSCTKVWVMLQVKIISFVKLQLLIMHTLFRWQHALHLKLTHWHIQSTPTLQTARYYGHPVIADRSWSPGE